MCHGYHPEWEHARTESEEREGEGGPPSFLAEESSTETELLTDGGDGEDEDAE